MRVIIEPPTIGVFPYVKSLTKYTTIRKPPEIKVSSRRLTILIKISDSFFLVKNHNLLTPCKFLRLKYIQTVILFFLLARKCHTMHRNLLYNIKIFDWYICEGNKFKLFFCIYVLAEKLYGCI